MAKTSEQAPRAHVWAKNGPKTAEARPDGLAILASPRPDWDYIF
jgi:hypothetical protein